MLERYYIYDTKRLLMEFPGSKRTLKNLETQYATLDGARALDYGAERVDSSRSFDSLEKIALQRTDLKAKIDGYRRDIELIECCLNALPENEQLAIEEFFFKDKSKAAAVVSLCDKLALEQSAVYALRRRAIHNFERLLFG